MFFSVRLLIGGGAFERPKTVLPSGARTSPSCWDYFCDVFLFSDLSTTSTLLCCFVSMDFFSDSYIVSLLCFFYIYNFLLKKYFTCFVLCGLIFTVWYAIYAWLGMVFVILNNLSFIFSMLIGTGG